MTQKIDAWKEFVEKWDDTAQNNRWEIVVSGCEKEEQYGKTNCELLRAFNYKEAKDYCKYLQIPILNTWTKEQMIQALQIHLRNILNTFCMCFSRKSM